MAVSFSRVLLLLAPVLHTYTTLYSSPWVQNSCDETDSVTAPGMVTEPWNVYSSHPHLFTACWKKKMVKKKSFSNWPFLNMHLKKNLMLQTPLLGESGMRKGKSKRENLRGKKRTEAEAEVLPLIN